VRIGDEYLEQLIAAYRLRQLSSLEDNPDYLNPQQLQELELKIEDLEALISNLRASIDREHLENPLELELKTLGGDFNSYVRGWLANNDPGYQRLAAEKSKLINLTYELNSEEEKKRAEQATLDLVEHDKRMREYRVQLDPALLDDIKRQLVRENRAAIDESIQNTIERQCRIRKLSFQAMLDQYYAKRSYHQETIRRFQHPQISPHFETQDLKEIDREVQSSQKERAVFFEGSALEAGVGYATPTSSQIVEKRKVYDFDLSPTRRKIPQTKAHSRQKFSSSFSHLDTQAQNTFWKIIVEPYVYSCKWNFSADDQETAIQQLKATIQDMLESSKQMSQEQLAGPGLQVVIESYAQLLFEYAYREIKPTVETSHQANRLPGFHAVLRDEQEDRVVEQIKALGGKLVPYEPGFPSYNDKLSRLQNWKWSLKVGDSTVSYVPRKIAADFHVQQGYRNEAKFNISPTLAAKMRERLQEKIEPQCIGPEEMVVIPGRWGGERVAPISLEYVSPQTRNLVQEAISTGQPVDIPLGTWAGVGENQKVTVRQAGGNDEQLLGENWMQVGERWLYGESLIRHYQKLLEGIDEVEGSSYYSQWEATDDQWDSEAKSHYIRNLKLCQGEKTIANPSSPLGDLIDAGLLDDVVQVKSEPNYTQAEQQTPLSEQRRLTIDGPDMQEAETILKKIGCVQKAAESVPYNMAYDSPNRSGPLIQKHPDYLQNNLSPRMPAGCMITHGMTGVRDKEAALERFENIVRAGGMKSTAQRRQMGIRVNSLSPIGDTLSGIDDGVPASIGPDCNYNEWVVFAFKPEILERAQIWFANTDYGGGHNRFAEYDAYARGIGQESFRLPPSHQSRQKHLSEGVMGHEDNEVYFAGGIRWEEIDSVYVRNDSGDNFYQELMARIQSWQQEGLLPKDLHVAPYGSDDIREKISLRASALAQSTSYWAYSSTEEGAD
jgi:hypothetical protein